MGKTKYKSVRFPVDELSEPLHQIYYLVDKRPLHKLIPSGYFGSPGFSANGTFISGDEGKHVSVTLGVTYSYPAKWWTCRILIRDGDDMFYLYEKPFTLEEWETALKIYNDLYMFDPALLHEDFYS